MRLYRYLNKNNIFEEIRFILNELALDAAIEFAQEMHSGQTRKVSQKPYVAHPQAVYSILKSFNIKDKVLLIAAWLHDTIEDTSTTYNIIKKKFNKEVADLVKAVSSDKQEIDKMGKEEYLLQKMLKMSSNALTLKLADRLHNVTDITMLPDKKAVKLKNQTIYILNGLREKRNLNQKQKKIVKAIERYLQ